MEPFPDLLASSDYDAIDDEESTISQPKSPCPSRYTGRVDLPPTPRHLGRRPIRPEFFNGPTPRAERTHRAVHEGYSSDTPAVTCSTPRHRTLDEEKRAKAAAAQEKRRATMAANHARRRDLEAWRAETDRKAAEEAAKAEATHQAAQTAVETAARKALKERVMLDVIRYLAENGLTWGDLIDWISNPRSSCPAEQRYDGFFSRQELVLQVLGNWVSYLNCGSGRRVVRQWAIDYVKKLITGEGNKVTKSGLLQSRTKTVDESFVLGFDLVTLYHQLKSLSPTTTELLHAICTTTKQEKDQNEKSELRKQQRVGTALISLMGERSQKNSYFKHINALYLYATGITRQALSVVSHLGLSSSYTTIAAGSGEVESKVPGDGGTPSAEDKGNERQDPGAQVVEEDVEESVGQGEEEESEEESCDSSEESEGSNSDSDSDFWDVESDDKSDISSDEDIPLREMIVKKQHRSATATTTDPTSITSNARVCLSSSRDVNLTVPSLESETDKPQRKYTGLLQRLSMACRLTGRTVAQLNPTGCVYDNINWINKIAEQVIGRSQSQENGTCATVFPLFNARREDMKTNDLMESMDKAPQLRYEDIELTQDEASFQRKCLIHAVLRIIIAHGGEQFARFSNDVEACLPVTEDQIPVHKTEIFPLPAMNINEGSIVGNAEVMQAIFKELGVDLEDDKFLEEVRVVFGDLLSVTNLRSVTGTRIGHDSPAQAFANVVSGHAFFHGQIHIVGGTLETHWGSGDGQQDPGSLSIHNTVLGRKPITITSPPPYRTCRDLIMISLYARVLHCLELVSKCNSLDAYPEAFSFSQLYEHATQIVDQFANSRVVDRLRRSRTREMEKRAAKAKESESVKAATTKNGKVASTTTTAKATHPAAASAKDTSTGAAAVAEDLLADTATTEDAEATTKPSSHGTENMGDTVFENGILFMRDALMIREFTDAIKRGDSGRLILCIKTFALSYRGSGRTKYAHEMLHLVHNLTHVWPKPLRNIIISNWLVNPTGMENAFIPVDLLQEHMNFWVKAVYAAKGSNASWEWLEKVSPCINILRLLATQMNSTLGTKLGTKHHTPDLSNDIRELLKSLRSTGVYDLRPGRVLDGDKAQVPNISLIGQNNLVGPLKDYNEAFEVLRERYRDTPLIGKALLPLRTSSDRRFVATTIALDNKSQLSETAQPSEAMPQGVAASIGMGTIDDELFKESSTQSRMEFTFDDEADLSLDM